MKRNPISEASPPNNAVLVTAARVRFAMNPKGSIWAAARDGGRSAAPLSEQVRHRGGRDRETPLCSIVQNSPVS
jgi:hypothetical protein